MHLYSIIIYIYTYFHQLLLHTSLQPELLRNLQHKNRVLILHKNWSKI